MHNSKNSAVGKVIFTGTQLAQARLLGITADTNNPNPNDLQEQIEADTQAKVSVYPRLFKPKAQNSNVPKELESYLSHKSKELSKTLDSLEVELLDKAYRYNIPYINEHDLSLLENKIDEWENLLSQAEELGIDWDESDYDVVGLEQEIETSERAEYEARGDMYSSYYANVGV